MLKLRELNESDLSIINTWRNDKNLIDNLRALFRFIGPEADKILGLVCLTSIDQLNQPAEFHIMNDGSENQGRGIGTFAVNDMPSFVQKAA